MLRLLLAVGISAFLIGGFLGFDYGRGKSAVPELKAAEKQLSERIQATIGSNVIESRYVQQVEAIHVPSIEFRDRVVAAACGLRAGSGAERVPGRNGDKPVDGAGARNADAALIDGIRADAEACQRNAVQLTELQALIRANLEGAR